MLFYFTSTLQSSRLFHKVSGAEECDATEAKYPFQSRAHEKQL